MQKLPVAVLLLSLLKVSESVQVVVSQTQYSTTLFANVILRCDYSTSANIQDVLVTWIYKSFCMDPVTQYYSTAYQSALQLGQDPSNNCQDNQRTVRTVIQKKGSNGAILGTQYQERKISIQNKADLVINEVMWWDNGMYYCSVTAAGDTSGVTDSPVKLIVYGWLTVLLMIIGALLLLMLICICCCQCCPQICCCYVRCPCCPQKCCCPEKTVMQHRMMKEAKKAMNPWLGGQPIYAPLSHVSSQMNPMLYPGSVSGNSIPLKPMPLPPPQSSAYSMPPPSAHTPANSHMLDYLENQVRGLDVNSPLLQSQPPPPPHAQQFAPPTQQFPPPAQHMPINVPFSPGPPSMISALNDGPIERRVITLPPLRESHLGRIPPLAPKTRPPSSSESNHSGYSRRNVRGSAGRRYPSPPRSRGIPRSYSEESVDGPSHSRARESLDRPRSRSRDDLFDSRSRGNYSRRGSWSSDDDDGGSRRGAVGGGRGRGGGWTDKPPSYSEYEPGQKPGARRNDQYSEKASRGGASIVI